MKFFVVLILSFVFSFFLNSSVGAQSSDWVQMNGPGGGMITSVAVASSGHILAARIDEVLSFGGVFRSVDNGAHWVEADSGLNFLHGQYGALKTDSYGNIFLVSDTDIFRTSDEGAHWSRMNEGFPAMHNINSMVVNSQTGYLYAFIDSGKYLPSLGMYRSTDHGSHWSKTSDQRFGFGSAAMDSSGSIFFIYRYRGIYKSTNEGSSWVLVSKVYPDWMSATKNGILFGCISADHKILRSIDNGVTWLTVDSIFFAAFIGPPFIAANGSVFFGLSGTGRSNAIRRSTTFGDSWSGTDAGLEHLPFSEAKSFAQNAQGQIFAGLTQGVYRSDDNGDHWVRLSEGLLLSACSEIIEGTNGHLFAGTDFGQVFRSRDSGMNWQLISDGIKVVPIPRVIVFGSQGGIWGELAPLKFAAAPNGHLFAGTNTINYLYRSVDEGDHWIPVDSSFYTRTLGIDKSGRIFAEAYSLTENHEAIFRSSDDGDHWTKVSPSGTFDSLIAVSIVSNQAEHVFIAGYYFDRLKGITIANAVYISTDHGDTWNLTGTEIAPYTINTLAVGAGKLVYAGADSGGIFRSSDEGAHWSQVHRLFDSAVTSLTIHPDGTVFAGLSQRGLEFDAGLGQIPYDTLGGEVLVSTDNGVSWKSQKSGIKNLSDNGISAISATSSGYIFAGVSYGKGGGIYRSFRSTKTGAVKDLRKEDLCWLRTVYHSGSSPTFEFSIPHDGISELEIYNEDGERVDVITPGYLPKGIHSASWNAEKNSSGIYFVRLRAANSTATTSLILTK